MIVGNQKANKKLILICAHDQKKKRNKINK